MNLVESWTQQSMEAKPKEINGVIGDKNEGDIIKMLNLNYLFERKNKEKIYFCAHSKILHFFSFYFYISKQHMCFHSFFLYFIILSSFSSN